MYCVETHGVLCNEFNIFQGNDFSAAEHTMIHSSFCTYSALSHTHVRNQQIISYSSK